MLDNRSTGNSELCDHTAAAPSQPAEPTAEAQVTEAAPATDSAIAALADRVATARGKLPLQTDPALFAELSEAEIDAERDLAEWMRAQRRRQRRRAVSAELAAEKRDRRVALSVRRADDADVRWHRRALAARRRVSNPDARLAQLYRRAEWSSRALIGVVVLGMLWAGVNVQHNLVPSGDMSDPLYWLSYGFEAMISIPIITIMVVATTAARWGREIARGKVVFLEAALLGVTIALNAGPHLAAGELARAAESAVAPAMVGVVIWLHAWVSARYAQLIDALPLEADTTPDDPPRSRTTIEFGQPRTTPLSEYTSGDSAALPIGRTDAGPDFTSRFTPAAHLFDTAAASPRQSPIPTESRTFHNGTAANHRTAPATAATAAHGPLSTPSATPQDISAEFPANDGSSQPRIRPGHHTTAAPENPRVPFSRTMSAHSAASSYPATESTAASAHTPDTNAPHSESISETTTPAPPNSTVHSETTTGHASSAGSPATPAPHPTITHQPSNPAAPEQPPADHRPAETTEEHRRSTPAHVPPPARNLESTDTAGQSTHHNVTPLPSATPPASKSPHHPDHPIPAPTEHTPPPQPEEARPEHPQHTNHSTPHTAAITTDSCNEQPHDRAATETPRHTDLSTQPTVAMSEVPSESQHPADTSAPRQSDRPAQPTVAISDSPNQPQHPAGVSAPRQSDYPTRPTVAISDMPNERQHPAGVSAPRQSAHPAQPTVAINDSPNQPQHTADTSTPHRSNHPAQRAAAMSEAAASSPGAARQDAEAASENSRQVDFAARQTVRGNRAANTASRPTATAERGTQLALDEQTVAEMPVRRRPRIVPDPEPELRTHHDDDARHPADAHDPWDDGDEIDPDSDETGVWTVAREISARRLSKLPVEQLAEVLTLADESWTPAAIGASIGLPGSRILGILEAARRLARPYAVGS